MPEDHENKTQKLAKLFLFENCYFGKGITSWMGYLIPKLMAEGSVHQPLSLEEELQKALWSFD